MDIAYCAQHNFGGDDHTPFLESYNAAMQAERELWERVKTTRPGQPGFNKALFDQWLEAVARTTAASKALREAFSTNRDPDELE